MNRHLAEHPAEQPDPAAVILADAAFGATPARWPLPAAATPEQRWHRAVAAAGQGRYAAAFTDLAALLRRPAADRWTSLAHSTRGSLLRQLGGHAAARGLDGRALRLAGFGVAGDPEAVSDALIGLAADALGLGRFAVSAALLARAAQQPGPVPLRCRVRGGWVAAELAMVSGGGAAAVPPAEAAVESAGGLASVRHRVKSQVVLAGALCSAGRLDRARAVADAALADAEANGLIPLCWALSCLLGDIGSAERSPAQLQALRADTAALITARGGLWQVG